MALLALLLATAACGDPSDSGAPAPGRSVTCAATSGAGTLKSSDWLQYHGGPTRAGVERSSPPYRQLTGTWTTGLDGKLFAQPLVAGSYVIAATSNDTVYALNSSSGCIAWSAHLGEPVPLKSLKCGITPLEGIIATPAIDPGSRTVYALTYSLPLHHELVGLDLDTGAVRFRVSADPAGSDPLYQLARGALTITGNRVLASFGGRAGDCGDFHGYLTSFALDGGSPVTFQVSQSRGGALWTPPGPTILPSGDILVASGNVSEDNGSGPDGGNSVLRLTPDLNLVDSFTPANWHQLDQVDFDLGSDGPTLVDGSLVYQSGKDGRGYLLDPAHLGGVGGQVSSLPLNGCYAIGGTAYQSPLVYVPCDHGLKAVKVSGRQMSIAWRGPDFRSGSPIVAGGLVWDYDFEGGRLYGLDTSDGHAVVRQTIGAGEHFVSLAAGGGRLYVPAGTRLLAFSGV